MFPTGLKIVRIGVDAQNIVHYALITVDFRGHMEVLARMTAQELAQVGID